MLNLISSTKEEREQVMQVTSIAGYSAYHKKSTPTDKKQKSNNEPSFKATFTIDKKSFIGHIYGARFLDVAESIAPMMKNKGSDFLKIVAKCGRNEEKNSGLILELCFEKSKEAAKYLAGFIPTEKALLQKLDGYVPCAYEQLERASAGPRTPEQLKKAYINWMEDFPKQVLDSLKRGDNDILEKMSTPNKSTTYHFEKPYSWVWEDFPLMKMVKEISQCNHSEASTAHRLISNPPKGKYPTIKHEPYWPADGYIPPSL